MVSIASVRRVRASRIFRLASSAAQASDSFALSDVAPRANHLDHLTVLVPDQLLSVIHPAVGAVLLEKSVLDRVGTFLEQLASLSLHRGEVVGMHAAPPEIRLFEIFLRLVTKSIS